MITTQKIITNYRRTWRELWQTWMAWDATNEKIIKRIAAFNVWVEVCSKPSILETACYGNVLTSGAAGLNKLIYFLLMLIAAYLLFLVCGLWQQAMSLSCLLNFHVCLHLVGITATKILCSSLSNLIVNITIIYHLNIFL